MRKLAILSFFGIILQFSNTANAFSVGEHWVCGFDKILRFYDDREPYLTDSYDNQSPFSFVIEKDNLKTGENWFVGASVPISYIGKSSLTAFNGTDIIKLSKKTNGRVSGYAGSLDGYIKMFFVSCRRL